jgi:putative copper export protein
MATASTIVTLIVLIPLDKEGYMPLAVTLGFYMLFLGLAGISHAKAVLTNPGTIPINSEGSFNSLMEHQGEALVSC